MIIKKCLVCGNDFKTYLCRPKSKYCSRVCSDKVTLIKKGTRIGLATEFKKGHKFWFGKKRANIKGNPETLKKSIYRQKNEKHPGWVGDSVGYSGLHSWLRRNFTKNECSFCHSNKDLQWANKSHEYKRDISDWMCLCRKCHSIFDRENGWGDACKKFTERRNYK